MDFFHYIPTFKVLVCITCQKAEFGDNIRQHLRNFPHNLPKGTAQIEEAYQWVQQVDHIRNQKDLSRIPFPIPLGPPIQELGGPRSNGFKCTFDEPSCSQVCASQREMNRHLRDIHHDLSHTGKRGRPAKGKITPSSPHFRTQVYYQRLFGQGPRSEYFEVNPSIQPELLSDQKVDFKGYFASYQQSHRKEANAIEQTNQFLQPAPWIDRLGSAAHLKDFSDKKDYLRSLISLDLEKDEPTPAEGLHDDNGEQLFYALVLRVLDQLVWETRGLIYRLEIPFTARVDVQRVSHQMGDTKPFTFSHKAETKKRYINVVKQFILYALRCLDEDSPGEKPPFKASAELRLHYDTVTYYGDALVDRWQEVEGDLSDQKVVDLMEKLKYAILALFIIVLRQPVKDADHDSILVSFLAVLSIAPDGSWHSFDTFTPWLAGIISISRLFVLREAYRIRQSVIKTMVDDGWSLEAATEDAVGIPRQVQKLTSAIFINDRPKSESMPMQYIFRLLSYGRAAKGNNAARGQISWKGSEVSYRGTQLTLSSVAMLLQSTIGSARRLLYRDLLFQPYDPINDNQPAFIPLIPWAKLQSHTSQDQVGFSVAESLFTAVQGSENWVLSVIMGRPDLKARWFPSSSSSSSFSSTGNGLLPNVNVLSSYLTVVDQLLEHLLLLIHLTAGLPARSTELLTIRHTNTATGGLRNIFIDQDLVMIVIGIHKTLTKSQRLKIIHRFLPEEVGTLLIYYLWLVAPFSTASLLNLPCNKDCIRSPFLWLTSGIGESEEIFKAKQVQTSDQMLDVFRAKSGYPVEKKRPVAAQNEDDAPRIQPLDGKHVNPSIKPFNPSRMTRIMVRFAQTADIDSLGISHWRHISVAIGRRFIRDTSVISLGLFSDAAGEDSDSDASDQEVHGEKETAVTMQTGHTAQTNALVYGRGINEHSFETSSRHAAFRALSKEWHYLLGMPSALRTAGTLVLKGRKRTGASLDLDRFEQLQKSRFAQLRAINLHSELDRVMGRPSSAFKEGQHTVLSCIMRQDHPIVAVMPTGGGKSLLFQLPAAACPSGVTIVVVPLVSLQGNLLDRTRKMKIPTAQWKSDQMVGDARLVFVTPETLFTKHFQSYLDILYSQALLDRIVIDECHTILEGSIDFRPKMRELGLLGKRDVQLVFLTATLPVAEESDFFRLIYSTPKDATFIRLPTTRPNISYRVVTFSLADTDNIAAVRLAAIRELVDQTLARHEGASSTSKVIIYCSRKSETRSLANALGCDAYYSDVGTDDEKARRLREWMHAIRPGMYHNGRVIVATNALGLGIDVPDIRLVLHLEMPRRIGEYGQQSGRAGRDGLPSEAILLRPASRPGQVSDQVDAHAHLDPSCRDFLSGGRCRRVALDRGLDGRQDRLGCEEGEERCDFCQINPSTSPPSTIHTAPATGRVEVTTEGTTAAAAAAAEGTAAAVAAAEAGHISRQEDKETQSLRLRQITVSLVRNTVSRQATEEKAEYEHLRQLLASQLREGCLFCRILDVQVSDHIPMACTSAKQSNRDDLTTCFRQSVHLQNHYRQNKLIPKYGGCFSCLLPQELCNTWQEDMHNNWTRIPGEVCYFRGLIICAFITAFYRDTDQIRQLLQDEGFQDDIPEPSASRAEQVKLWSWLGEKVSWADVTSIRLCRIFVKLERYLPPPFSGPD